MAALERAEYLLERMLELAERSAEDACTDERRKVLQKMLLLSHPHFWD